MDSRCTRSQPDEDRHPGQDREESAFITAERAVVAFRPMKVVKMVVMITRL
jgi:hypothetical protein